MSLSRSFVSLLAGIVLFAGAGRLVAEDKPGRKIKVGVIPERMKFDPEWLTVTPGERVTIELVNSCRMQHNLVVCRPGEGVTMRVAQAAWLLGASAVDRAYVPDHPAVLIASPLVDPGKTGRFTFVAPDEPGDYPFVCTLPGHALSMTGILHVGKITDQPVPREATGDGTPRTALGRARQKMKRYQHLMDSGPVLAGVFLPGKARMKAGAEPDFRSTNRGIAIRVGEGREGTVLFDSELLKVTASWSGGFIDYLPNRADEHAEYRLQIGGTIEHSLGTGAGWASSDGVWEDPRESGLGVLEKDRAHYLGHYRAGERVVLHYRVNGAEVLESPWLTSAGAFTRDFLVAPCRHTLRLRLARAAGTEAALSEVPGVVLREVGGFHEIEIPPRDQSVLFQAALGGKPCVAAGPVDLERLRAQGNRGNTSPPIFTVGSLGKGEGAYVVDTLTLPYENYWNALLYTSGLDFFSNGDIALCTSHGDVWTVSGVDATLRNLTWRRMAGGLANPLGLRIVDEEVYVAGLHGITRLRDFDRDGTADYYQSFNADVEVTHTHHRFTTDLQTDSRGRFYYVKCTEHGRTSTDGAVIRVSADGSTMNLHATGVRNSNGMGMGPGDFLTFSKQQGDWIPTGGINVVEEGRFYGYKDSWRGEGPPTEFAPPMVWIPQGVDSSCGGQAWAPADGRWGPLGGKMIHLSYGKCRMFLVLHQKVGEIYQAGVIQFPGIEFESGAMRGRFRPQDGQLYVSGLRGWQTTGALPGCLQRVRYTGEPTYLPTNLGVSPEGVRLSFEEELDPETATDPARYSVRQWNYRWWKNYGSPAFKVSNPEEKGTDDVPVGSIELSPDRKSVLIRIDGLQPVMQMEVSYDLSSVSGKPVRGQIYNTIHALGPE